MAVRMREILAKPWVGVCMPLALNLSYYVYDRACLSYISFSISQRSVNFLGIVHLTTTTFWFTEQKHYLINAKIATEIGLKTLFHNIAYK